MEDLMSNDEVQQSIGRNPKTQELEIVLFGGQFLLVNFMRGRFCSRSVGKTWESSKGAF